MTLMLSFILTLSTTMTQEKIETRVGTLVCFNVPWYVDFLRKLVCFFLKSLLFLLQFCSLPCPQTEQITLMKSYYTELAQTSDILDGEQSRYNVVYFYTVLSVQYRNVLQTRYAGWLHLRQQHHFKTTLIPLFLKSEFQIFLNQVKMQDTAYGYIVEKPYVCQQCIQCEETLGDAQQGEDSCLSAMHEYFLWI